jgi:hypothetical protein
VDAIIRSARETHGKRSEKLAKRFPALQNHATWTKVATAVAEAFGPEAAAQDGAGAALDTRSP